MVGTSCKARMVYNRSFRDSGTLRCLVRPHSRHTFDSISPQILIFNFRHPVLIDAVIQSGGVGFLGTDRSTMSTLARRRVQSWHNGVVRTVKWGGKGADDH